MSSSVRLFSSLFKSRNTTTTIFRRAVGSTVAVSEPKPSSLKRNPFLPTPKPSGQNDIKVEFEKDGKIYPAYGKEGETLFDLIVNNELDFDGFGACEGTLACSTCHVILEKDVFDKIPNQACDEELDMLDLAYDLTRTSRLGCQITLSRELNNIRVTIPATRHDARS